MKNKIKILASVMIPLTFMTSCSGPDTKEEKSVANAVDSPVVYIRKNANLPAAAADLEAMNKALQIMRGMDCSAPASWYYQGAIHWVPDTVPNGNPFCSSYVSVNLNQLKLAWNNCTHDTTDNSGFNFLIWHRFYILHFEQIVRELSGKKDFALPYWDYTATSNVEMNRKMPEPLRVPGNSLYEESRLDSLNKGYPISAFMNQNLDVTELMQQTTYPIFNSQINNAPHGVMHNYIGGGYTTLNIWNPIYQDTLEGGGLMANVPSAGFDPVFWLHHSNIDRLWQQWTNMSSTHMVPAEDVIMHPWTYTFFDAKGNTIQYTMEEVAAKMYNMNYRYDNIETPVLALATEKNASTAGNNQTGDTLLKLKIGKNAGIKNKITTQTIAFDSPKTPKLKAFKSEQAKTVLLIVNVSFKKEPKNDYYLYVNLPEGKPNGVQSQNFVGILNFFGAKHHASHNKNSNNKKGLFYKTFTFDVSDEIRDTKAFEQKSLQLSLVVNGAMQEEGITLESYTLINN